MVVVARLTAPSCAGGFAAGAGGGGELGVASCRDAGVDGEAGGKCGERERERKMVAEERARTKPVAKEGRTMVEGRWEA